MSRPVITITISGAQGVGKTRLAGALLEQLLEFGAMDVDIGDEPLVADWKGIVRPSGRSLRKLLGSVQIKLRTTHFGVQLVDPGGTKRVAS